MLLRTGEYVRVRIECVKSRNRNHGCGVGQIMDTHRVAGGIAHGGLVE